MRLRRITLRHFRNVGFTTLELAGARQFLVGRNGQGKTNLLEAAGFVTDRAGGVDECFQESQRLRTHTSGVCLR